MNPRNDTKKAASQHFAELGGLCAIPYPGVSLHPSPKTPKFKHFYYAFFNS
jgi:hypothetical protein